LGAIASRPTPKLARGHVLNRHRHRVKGAGVLGGLVELKPSLRHVKMASLGPTRPDPPIWIANDSRVNATISLASRLMLVHGAGKDRFVARPHDQVSRNAKVMISPQLGYASHR
jgi:hypothetical protein